MIRSMKLVERRCIGDRTSSRRVVGKSKRLKMRPGVDAFEFRSSLCQIAEAAIISGIAKHENNRFAGTPKPLMADLDKRRPDAAPPTVDRDGEWSKARTSRTLRLARNPQAGEAEIADDLSRILGHKRQQEIAGVTKIIDQIGFLIAAKCSTQNIANGCGVEG